MARTVSEIKAMFKKVNDARSRFWAGVSDDVTKMEKKVDGISENLSRYIRYLEIQRRTIERQLQLIAIREAERRAVLTELDRFCCGICFTHDKDTAFSCGHVFCGECARKLVATKGFCPICRKTVTAGDILPIHFGTE